MAADELPETIIRRHHAWTGVPHTALCVEPRDGKLYVFMPLMSALAHFAELLAAVEATAAELSIPVLIEGYDPPRDPALRIAQGHAGSRCHRGQHPPGLVAGRSWSRTSSRCTRRRAVHVSAPRSSCSTAGTPARVAGTTSRSAAPTPQDSPFLRRPHLLRSFITYWQHHPSLSYLFSGMFVGANVAGTADRRARQPRPARARTELRGDRAAASRRG